MRFTRYDRWETQLGSVRPITATHEEDLDGTDTLTITTFDFVEKGDRLVWRDLSGQWHEHVVDSVQRIHDSNGRSISNVTAINSICETLGDYIGSLTLTDVSVASALASVISAGGSRWLSSSDVQGTFSFTFENTSVREAINQIIEEANAGELRAYVTIGSTSSAEVYTRVVQIKAERGSSTATRRFTYSRNVTSVRRIVESTDPVTALYAYGKASEDSNGNVSRLDISSVNGGLRYVEDTSARDSWGRWNDSKTAKVHHFGYYVDENCTDASFLKAQAQRQLANLSQPEITYEADVIDAEDALRGVALGDHVDIVDTAFDPPVRMRQRVTRIKRDLMLETATGTVTIGKRKSYLVMRYVEDATEKKAKTKTTSTSTKTETIVGSGGSALDQSWLDNLANRLNSDPSYLQDLADALVDGGYISGGGGNTFPTVNDATTPTVQIDDLDASNLQGISLQAKISSTLQNLLRVYRKDGYGGIYVDVGMAARRVAEVEQYSAGGQLTLYVPSDSIADLSQRGFIRLADGNVYMRGQRTGLLGSGDAYGTVQADASGASMFTPRSGIGVSNTGVDIYVASYASGISITSDYIGLAAGSTTLELKSDGVYVDGTKISTS